MNILRNNVARSMLKLLLSATAIALSMWLLLGYETEPDIFVYDADASSHAISALQAVRNGVLATETHVMQGIARDMQASYAAQRAISEDTAGWLLIPNMCYYPIMYNPVYDYYLTHNPQQNVSAHGSIFINYQCEPNFTNMLTLIHGHSMLDGTMFGRLRAYLGQDFFQHNGPLLIYDGQYIRTYKPFTVVVIEENNDVIDARALSDEERENYILSMYARSLCPMEGGEAPDLTQPILFLSTCDYSFSEARLLVGAYQTAMWEVKP